MLHFIYCRPLKQIAFIMLALVIAWAVLGRCCLKNDKTARAWRILNCVLVAAAVAAVLYTTLFVRSAGENDYSVDLRPFKTFMTAQANPELYRTMLMNVFLFEPLGLSLSSALPNKWTVRRRILLTVSAGIILSCSVELIQYVKCLGWVETDDVLCNTFGTLVGALSILRQRKFAKSKQR